MPTVHKRQRVGTDCPAHVSCCLHRAKITAVGKRGQEVALSGPIKLRIRARQRAEVARPAGVVVYISEDIEEVSLGHATEHGRLQEFGGGTWSWSWRPFETGLAFLIDDQLTIGRIEGVHLSGCVVQPGA